MVRLIIISMCIYFNCIFKLVADRFCFVGYVNSAKVLVSCCFTGDHDAVAVEIASFLVVTFLRHRNCGCPCRVDAKAV